MSDEPTAQAEMTPERRIEVARLLYQHFVAAKEKLAGDGGIATGAEFEMHPSEVQSFLDKGLTVSELRAFGNEHAQSSDFDIAKSGFALKRNLVMEALTSQEQQDRPSFAERAAGGRSGQTEHGGGRGGKGS